MSSSDSDVSMEEDEGPNEYDMEDGFMAPDESQSSPEDDGEEATEVGEHDLTPEEREIYRQSQRHEEGPRRSRRRRKAVERYQDPEYRRLMTDNGQDVVSDDDDETISGRHSDREYQPEVDNGFSMDEESESDSDYSEG